MEFDLNFSKIGVNIDSNGKSLDKNSPLIATPIHIANDMIKLFPENQFDNNHIFMDLYCKTGNLLKAVKQKIGSSDRLIAICDNKQSQMLVCRVLYGKLYEEIDCSTEINTITRRGQVYYISNYKDIVKNNLEKYIVDIFRTIKEQYMLEFKSEDNFKFNNIIMNPPYNPSDLYIDFVTLAHKIASEYVVAITPAKWQAKGGDKNEQFRKNIVPYISKVIYYLDSHDVFDIGETGGITYYIINTVEQKYKEITNICSKLDIFNSTQTRELKQCLNNYGYTFINKINYKPLEISELPQDKRFRYRVSKLYSDRNINKANNVLNPANIEDSQEPSTLSDNYLIRYSSDNETEVKYFVSYVNTKFVRFCILIGLCASFIVSNEAWRFVPDPGKFDHIFTDAELYQKYDLTPDEISIIESVIKERK